jgi:hypothetical protein
MPADIRAARALVEAASPMLARMMEAKETDDTDKPTDA